jgi:hypothetical protein
MASRSVPIFHVGAASRGDAQRSTIAMNALAGQIVTDPRVVPTWAQLMDRMLSDLPEAAAEQRHKGLPLNDQDRDLVAESLVRHGPTFRRDLLKGCTRRAEARRSGWRIVLARSSYATVLCDGWR